MPQDARAFRELATRGIKIDVELETGHRQSQRESRWASAAGIRYIHLPRFPWPFFLRPHQRVVANFLKILADNADKAVYLHCRQGSNRTGVVIVAYQIEVAHCSKKVAVQGMRRFGYHWYMFPLWECSVKHLASSSGGRKTCG